MKKWVNNEPLVDLCPENCIVTDTCPILYLDLQTCTKEDLDFASSYTITPSQNTYVNGLVIWFDNFFSFGSSKVILTTSIIP